MSEDEFNAAVEATRRGVQECMRDYANAAPQSGSQAAQGPPGMSQAQNGPAPSTALTAAANGQSIYGPCQSAYGIARTAPAGWTPLRWLRHRELLGSAYGEQCADTDGLAVVAAEWDRPYMVSDGDRPQARVAALEAKLNATMADAQSLQCQNESLQRQNEHWQAECRRLSALLIETQEELARRMALPSNALRHGGVR